MINYKIVIQYDGSKYKGWQRQGNGNQSIQGKIEHVLSEMSSENIEIIGCSRTDAGVHAKMQVANFRMSKQMKTTEIMTYVNRYLPNDICVTSVESVHDRFHARYVAKDKTYVYQIWNKSYSDPFIGRYSMHVEKKLDIEKMKIASGYFIGSHDFTAFSNAKSKKKSMVRKINAITFNETDGLIKISIRGDGFLYNMVRKIVGTLVEVGLGRIEPSQIPNMMESKDRSLTGMLAEAKGLCLEKVSF